MRRSARTFRWVAALALLLIGAGSALAGGDDPLMRHPDVFVIYDISGSMDSWAMSNPDRTRLTASIEVLTGTGSFPYHASGSCPGDQADDGIIDLYKNLIRFGLGAFDDDNPGGCNRRGGDSWNYGGDYGDDQKRGIRGRSAGMGRLVDVVDPDTPEDLATHNQRVQDVICGLTIHGCTPIAASLHDARQYFLNYESEITDSAGDPYTDPMGRNGGNCRQQFVLIMTDGQEYPSCDSCPADSSGNLCDEGHGGNYGTQCSWYGNEAVQAEKLAADPVNVPVFVVAFGSMDLASRMRMHRIARAGAGLDRSLWDAPEDFTDAIPEAYFASNPAQLRVAFTIILDAILAGSVSRTSAQTAPSSTAWEATYEYKATFEVGLVGPSWKGFITRDKLEDTNDDGVLEQTERLWFGPPQWSEAQAGDYFRSLPSWDSRRLLTIIKDARSKGFIPTSLNPTYRLPRYESMSPLEDGLYPFHLPFVPDNSMLCLKDPEGMGHNVLETIIKQYVAGKPFTPTDISGIRFSLPQPFGPHLGDIFHANPVVVTPPAALTPDFKYEQYFRANFDRHTMIYAGANDGFLHAFVAQDNKDDGVDEDGKELWAFMPNNLLAKIEKMRWGAHQFFVDSSPVVRDVYFPSIPTPNPDQPGTCLKDSSDNCLMGAYRTVLVTGEREGGPAYFALDVTDPENPGYLWEYRTTGLMDDYAAVQCKSSKIQTWSEPIIGEVWLKKANTTNPEYLTKSVVVIPGGFVPLTSFRNITTCIDIVEMMVNGGSLHVLDIETGELLKRFGFGSGAGSEMDMEQMTQWLDDFYADLAANPTSNWSHWGLGQSFGTTDFEWDNNPAGWQCSEHRHNIGEPPEVPEQLLNDTFCDVIENVGDIVFQRSCCASGNQDPPSKCTNFPGQNLNPHSCSYLYREYDDGRIESWMTTQGCANFWNIPGNSFHLQLTDASLIESMGATPAVYNPNQGEFITRMFGGTNQGRLYRMNLANAEYNAEAAEGEKIQAYTGNSSMNWKLEPDGPWYDPFDAAEVLAGHPRRPITVPPDLAVDYARDLVVFFGTGEIDNLEYNANLKDYFFAVKEERCSEDIGGDMYSVPCRTKGKLLDDVDPTMDGFKNDFMPSERLFGQPLVLFGNVHFTTFTPDDSECETGQGKFYVLKYDDFDNQVMVHTFTDKGPPSKPAIRWTARGTPEVVVQQGAKIVKPPMPTRIRPRTDVLFWGKVL